MSQSAHTCITCHVAFTNAEVQRLHYKSDWHRYNLKRKVVALPPSSVESFQEKVAAQQAQIATNKSNENVVGVACKVCQRKFTSFNSYNNHMKSKKHRDAEAKEMQNVKKKLQQTTQAHVEKSLQDNMDDIAEKKALNKALADARSSLQQPRVLRSDGQQSEQKTFSKGDNPRLRWYLKQVRALKERKPEENEDADDDSEEWEDMSDDDETIGHESDMDVASQTESNETDNSSLSGVFSKVKLDSDADIESLLSEGGSNQQVLGATECLFCSNKSCDIETNVSHMSCTHGFFIPELAYLTDLEGLLAYLGEKIGVGNVCIWCNEKGPAFYSLRAVRAHMNDKGHSKMLTDGDAALEYADFYDFRASYPDNDEEEDDSNSDGTMELSVVRENVHEDDSEEDFELVLPSGAKIGHRSLMRYYKQNFPSIERYNQRVRLPLIARLMAQYRSIGWHGMSASAVMKQNRRDMRFVQNRKAKYLEKLGTNNNKTTMKHFRYQIMF